MNLYQEYIFKSHYAREGESYEDAIDRVLNFLSIKDSTMRNLLVNQEIVSSMRLLKTAGPAAERDNAAIYNCAYTEIKYNFIEDISEIMYLLTCGCGVGFGLYTNSFCRFPRLFVHNSDYPFIIEDDRIGWCEALKHCFYSLLKGYIPTFDYSKIRPKGSPLVVFGGYASGPEILQEVLEFIIKIAKDNEILKAIHILDIICKVAEAIQCGGTRRSALICLTTIPEVAYSKSNYPYPQYRRFVNISFTYDEKPTYEEFTNIWSQYKNGEPGIFNRKAAKLATQIDEPGINPCGEIIMKSKQFCNLTEVVCRFQDTLKTLLVKLKYATELAMIQGKLNNFRYLSHEWKENSINYPIIGVSLTGVYDCPCLLNATPEELIELKKATDVSNLWIKYGYKVKPQRVTCIKPSGTVSQLMDCSAGIHPRISKYYIRNVLQCKESPLANFMIKKGFPYFVDPNNKDNLIFRFPCKAPNEVKEVSAKEQIEIYLKFKKYFVDHNISNTVYVKDWKEIGDIVYEHFDEIIGMAFFPQYDVKEMKRIYKYLPEEPCTEQEYNSIIMPTDVVWPDVKNKETIYECSGESCKIKS